MTDSNNPSVNFSGSPLSYKISSENRNQTNQTGRMEGHNIESVISDGRHYQPPQQVSRAPKEEITPDDRRELAFKFVLQNRHGLPKELLYTTPQGEEFPLRTYAEKQLTALKDILNETYPDIIEAWETASPPEREEIIRSYEQPIGATPPRDDIATLLKIIHLYSSELEEIDLLRQQLSKLHPKANPEYDSKHSWEIPLAIENTEQVGTTLQEKQASLKEILFIFHGTELPEDISDFFLRTVDEVTAGALASPENPIAKVRWTILTEVMKTRWTHAMNEKTKADLQKLDKSITTRGLNGTLFQQINRSSQDLLNSEKQFWNNFEDEYLLAYNKTLQNDFSLDAFWYDDHLRIKELVEAALELRSFRCEITAQIENITPATLPREQHLDIFNEETQETIINQLQTIEEIILEKIDISPSPSHVVNNPNIITQITTAANQARQILREELQQIQEYQAQKETLFLQEEWSSDSIKKRDLLILQSINYQDAMIQLTRDKLDSIIRRYEEIAHLTATSTQDNFFLEKKLQQENLIPYYINLIILNHKNTAFRYNQLASLSREEIPLSISNYFNACFQETNLATQLLKESLTLLSESFSVANPSGLEGLKINREKAHQKETLAIFSSLQAESSHLLGLLEIQKLSLENIADTRSQELLATINQLSSELLVERGHLKQIIYSNLSPPPRSRRTSSTPPTPIPLTLEKLQEESQKFEGETGLRAHFDMITDQCNDFLRSLSAET